MVRSEQYFVTTSLTIMPVILQLFLKCGFLPRISRIFHLTSVTVMPVFPETLPTSSRTKNPQDSSTEPWNETFTFNWLLSVPLAVHTLLFNGLLTVHFPIPFAGVYIFHFAQKYELLACWGKKNIIIC